MKTMPELNVKRILRYMVDFWNWLAEGKIVFMGAVVIISVILLGLYTFCSETSIRLSGYVLQFLGMIFAIRGLLGVRVHFGQPPLWQIFVHWLKRFPKWKKITVVDVKPGFVSTRGLTGKVEVWAPDKQGQPLENRFERLLENLNRLKKIQDNHSKSIEKMENNFNEHVKKVKDENKDMEERIKSEVEWLYTNDFMTSLVGLVWLIGGITLSTLAPELFELLCHF